LLLSSQVRFRTAGDSSIVDGIVKGIEDGYSQNRRGRRVRAAAALTFAPLASADDLTATVDSEIASLNSLYESDATLAGVSADLTTPTDVTGVLDTILPADIATVQGDGTTLYDALVYGPWASTLTADFDTAPGAQDLDNGALAEFDDAYNALAYGLAGDGSLVIPTTDVIGLADQGLDDGSLTDAALFGDFFNTGVGDFLTTLIGFPIPG
jgi:hypothetical protein